MFGQSDQGVGAGIVQWSGMPALNKVGETTATAPTPGNRDCCISRQYALRIKVKASRPPTLEHCKGPPRGMDSLACNH